MILANITEKIAKAILSGQAEKEVERLLKVVLSGTSFAGKTFSVGGYNRDEHMGLDAKDLDVVVEMKDGAEKLTHYISKIFYPAVTNPHQMGAGYPIWQITFKEDITYKNEIYKTEGAIIEFADTMKESFPDEMSRQRKTEFGTIQDDIERRDFTVNMLLKDLSTGEVLDMTGVSKHDIEEGILRGHPKVSLDKIFTDDPLRMLRLVRFYCKYGWKIPISVLNTVKRNANRIKIISAERIMGELQKIMTLGKLHKAIRLMKATGLLQYILPEVMDLEKTEQSPKYHSEGNAFRHTMMVLKNAPPTIEGQMAALLHDIGKPATQQILGEEIKFHGHAETGAKIAEAILYRLKFDAKTIQTIVKLVENHMRPLTLFDASEKSLRKFLREMGDELADTLLDLAEADAKGSLPVNNRVPELKERVRKIRESPVQVGKKPVLDGNEIMQILNVKAGPIIGKVTSFLMGLADEYAEQGKQLTKEDAEHEVILHFSKGE
jgi:poly(A) polymerase